MITDLLMIIYIYVVNIKRWIVKKWLLLDLFLAFTSSGWCTYNAANPIASNAIRCGTDSDGTAIFIGRASHEGHVVPAKVMPDKNASYIPFNGEEIHKEEVEILQTGTVAWEFCTNGEVPFGAVVAGETASGEKLYYGRCLHEGSQTPGKIQPSHGCLYIPYGGAEISVHEYEVLVLREAPSFDHGHHHHHHHHHHHAPPIFTNEGPTLY